MRGLTLAIVAVLTVGCVAADAGARRRPVRPWTPRPTVIYQVDPTGTYWYSRITMENVYWMRVCTSPLSVSPCRIALVPRVG